MESSRHNPWLHGFAAFAAFSTLLLIGLGGLVTSHEAGMAVPDWPTTYGYNMFLFPIHLWTGGIFWEHTHRLFASFVGLLTTILMVWLCVSDRRKWMKGLGVAAFFAVVGQGVLGGMRVALKMDNLGIPHAALAQLFLALLTSIALFTGRWWRQDRLANDRSCNGSRVWQIVLGVMLLAQLVMVSTIRDHTGGLVVCGLLIALPLVFLFAGSASSGNATASGNGYRRLAPLLLGTTLLIFAQLMIAATIRHQHIGLAVPDFPLAYGQVWPSTDQDFLNTVNANRMEIAYDQPIRAFDVHLHMTHRMVALLILLAVGICVVKSRTILGAKDLLSRWVLVWFALTCLQGILGAVTVLKNKPADIATLHVVVGALLLNLGVILTLISRRLRREWQPAPEARGEALADRALEANAAAG